MGLIGIVGSGNVGANTAFFLAERDVADVVLYDEQEGLSTGKALDMMEAAPIRNYQTKISGTDTFSDLLDADIVIVTAGAVRQPGGKREGLLEQNRETLADVAGRMKSFTGIAIVVSEPVDSLTTVFLDESGLADNRVMGLGGFLDSTRLRLFIANELGVSMENVTALVIGRHTDSMLPLADYCKVSGIPISALMTGEKIEKVFGQTRGAGDLIVDLAQRANAYYGPSATASDLCAAIVNNTRRICSVAVKLTGQFGIDGVAMSMPAIIGSGGVLRILEPVLNKTQKKQLSESAKAVKQEASA